MIDAIERVLLTEEQIAAGLDRVAREVAAHYAERPFTVVAVLKGSCIFVADLIRRLPVPLELAFVAATSYRDDAEPGHLELSFFPAEGEIRDRNLLLVDDILDSGRTLRALVGELEERGAAEVRTCVFLDKPSRRAVEIEPDFRCFEVEDRFVVGYGLDFAGRYRNLPYVGCLRPEPSASAAAPGRSTQP